MALIIKPSQLEESAKLGAQFRHCIHEEPEIGLYLPKTIGLRADSDALPWKKKPVSSGAVKFR